MSCLIVLAKGAAIPMKMATPNDAIKLRKTPPIVSHSLYTYPRR
jgi:hypothetical protein